MTRSNDWVLLLAMFALTLEAARAQSTSLLDRAEKRVLAYVNELADLHCTEAVEQVKLRPNGKAEVLLKSQYDYFLLMQGNSDEFRLAESRLEIGKAPAPKSPLLLTNGFSNLLLILHPYYRDSFVFTAEQPEDLDGRTTMRYRFVHRAGTRSPAALALREREYPLDLQGTAWLDETTGQPVRIDAELVHAMTDIGLQALKVRAEYAPIPSLKGQPVVPTMVEVDLETPRQHWRNSHLFRDYKLFSADATQDPNVKVHESKPATPPDSGTTEKQ